MNTSNSEKILTLAGLWQKKREQNRILQTFSKGPDFSLLGYFYCPNSLISSSIAIICLQYKGILRCCKGQDFFRTAWQNSYYYVPKILQLSKRNKTPYKLNYIQKYR